MKGENRREEIKKEIKGTKGPIKGSDLAKKYRVSRQVIVQDIALLRAQGTDIIATPQGYLLTDTPSRGIEKTIVIRHHLTEELEEELTLMVDYGVKVIDVTVEHPVYGEIRGNLNIQSRLDIENFVEQIRKQQAKPLAELTDGVHMHTIEVPSEGVYQKLLKALREKNYLIEG